MIPAQTADREDLDTWQTCVFHCFTAVAEQVHFAESAVGLCELALRRRTLHDIYHRSLLIELTDVIDQVIQGGVLTDRQGENQTTQDYDFVAEEQRNNRYGYAYVQCGEWRDIVLHRYYDSLMTSVTGVFGRHEPGSRYRHYRVA